MCSIVHSKLMVNYSSEYNKSQKKIYWSIKYVCISWKLNIKYL